MLLIDYLPFPPRLCVLLVDYPLPFFDLQYTSGHKESYVDVTGVLNNRFGPVKTFIFFNENY